MVTVLRMATIIGKMTNDQRRDGDPHRDGGRLQDSYHPKGWLLNFGSIETQRLMREFTLNYVGVTLSVSL